MAATIASHLWLLRRRDPETFMKLLQPFPQWIMGAVAGLRLGRGLGEGGWSNDWGCSEDRDPAARGARKRLNTGDLRGVLRIYGANPPTLTRPERKIHAELSQSRLGLQVGALILRHEFGFDAKGLGGVKRPGRVRQDSTADEDEVGARSLATISAASSGVRIRPTAPVLMPVVSRMRCANGTW